MGRTNLRRWLGIICLITAIGVAAAPARGDDFELGRDLCNDGRWEEALPVYEKMVRTHPHHPWAWIGLGFSLHYTGKYEDAIPAYRKAIELGAMDMHRPHLEISRCQAALGKKDDAMNWFAKAAAHKLPNIRNFSTDKRLELIWKEPAFVELVAAVDPAGKSRDDGWRFDLKLLAREIKRLHHNPYRLQTPAEFDQAVKEIHDAIPSSTDQQLTVQVMKLMQRLGDGHTYAEAKFQQSRSQSAVPVLFGQFDDGLFITAAGKGQEAVLWSKVESVDGKPIDTVLSGLNQISAQDNTMRPKSVAPMLLRYPQLLHGLGLVSDPTHIRLGLVDRQGQQRDAVLAVAGPVTDWVRRPDDAVEELPLHVRHRTKHYWFQHFPESKLVYLQYNGCAEMESEAMDVFAKRLTDFTNANPVEKLVIDLRWNGGGNQFVSKPLLDAIIRSRLNRRGGLYVITGRHTFSAAMIFAAQLERYTEAIFVGEPTGSSPNFVGETNWVTLPFSGIRVSISDLYWQNSHPKDHRSWIDPRIVVPFTFAAYRQGKDPALEAIIADRRGQ